MISLRRKITEQGALDPRFLVLVGMLLLAAGVGYAYFSGQTDDEEPVRQQKTAAQVTQPGTLRTDFTLPGLDGETIATTQLRGKVVLVNFWASWCPPCLREMPDLQEYYLAHRGEGFELIAVNYAEDALAVEEFVSGHQFAFPIALDLTGAVFDRQYLGNSLPTSFLIGPDGTLVKSWPPGALTQEIMERDITPLLEE